MSFSFLTAIDGHGTLLDLNISDTIEILANHPFAFTDLFIFSHGWLETPTSCMSDYSREAASLTKQFVIAGAVHNSLEIGVYWPSVADAGPIAKLLNPLTFYSRQSMADTVGRNGVYALIRLLLDSWTADAPLPVFHLIGHSFGARVAASALQALCIDPGYRLITSTLSIDLILLQAAFDNDSFNPGQDYGDVLSTIPALRVLATMSSEDRALCKLYPEANKLARLFSKAEPALGAVGFPTGTANLDSLSIEVDGVPDVGAAKIIEANLTQLHLHDGDNPDKTAFAGAHSDIFSEEVSQLIVNFIIKGEQLRMKGSAAQGSGSY